MKGEWGKKLKRVWRLIKGPDEQAQQQMIHIDRLIVRYRADRGEEDHVDIVFSTAMNMDAYHYLDSIGLVVREEYMPGMFGYMTHIPDRNVTVIWR